MTKHTHFSAIHAVGFFFIVIVMGTLWRLAASHLAASQNPTAQAVAKAMAFQY